LVINI